MRALLFKKGLQYLGRYPKPGHSGNEALVRVSCAGICSTDLEIIKGYMGFEGVLGHEFAGIVEESPDESLAGRRVVGEINIGCGVCTYCRNNLKNHCPHRKVLGIQDKDGAFAEYLTLPVDNLLPIPDSVSDEEAVFAEPLAAAFEITRQVNIGPEDRVCVLGDGRLGLLVAQAVSLTGCMLMVAGRHEDKLSILNRRGIETSPHPVTEKFDKVIDCTGSASGLDTALGMVNPGGTVVMKTTVAERTPVNMNRFVIDEITLVGSRCGPFRPAISAIEKGEVDVTPLISRIFRLEEGIEAIQYAGRRGVIKVLLRIS